MVINIQQMKDNRFQNGYRRIACVKSMKGNHFSTRIVDRPLDYHREATEGLSSDFFVISLGSENCLSRDEYRSPVSSYEENSVKSI